MPDMSVFRPLLWREWNIRFPGSRTWRILTFVWLAVWIGMPITLWALGECTFSLVATLGVLIQAAATSAGLGMGWPARRIMATLLLIAGLTWAVEWLGYTTGIPFGRYHYSIMLQPQVAGVPVIIPLAWWMMLGPAWAVASSVLTPVRRSLGRWYMPLFALLSGAAITAWDFYLDPQMADRGLWIWETSGGYFGIPWVNFFGWWLAAFLITWLVQVLGGNDNLHLPDASRNALLSIYTLTWLFQVIGLGIFWGQPGPALVGFIIMGLFAVAAWCQELHRA
jgi:uncharacterized membrane protein